MAESLYDRDFPLLRQHGFKRTSEPAYYNCIAHAVGDLHKRWWPGEYAPDWSDDYWPPGVPTDTTLNALVAALATVGFQPCDAKDDGSPEEGIEKIALYGFDRDSIKHAARQELDGSWTSKLGPDEDIHHTLAGLVGPCYGQVIQFLRRTRTNP